MTFLIFNILLLIYQIENIHGETVHGCTTINNNRRIDVSAVTSKTSVTLSCAPDGYILVRNLTFGVHKTPSPSPACSYQPGDCTTRTTYIGMECNGLTTCDLDLTPQYLHICSQYSDYMVLDYSCLQGPSLSVCDNRRVETTIPYRLFLRSPNYANEYNNSLNCSCQIETNSSTIQFLDFYLEERDEMNLCSRDRLQIGNRSFCGSTIDDNNNRSSTLLMLNSSTRLTFKTNDVITRKGFWLMIDSNQRIDISCTDTHAPRTTILTTTTTTATIATTLLNTARRFSFISTTSPPSLLVVSTASQSYNNRRQTLSYILIMTVIVVVALILLNLILGILCWRQRRIKGTVVDSKNSSTNRPFFCSVRSSASSTSSTTYGETPVLTSLDNQKRSTTATRYIFEPNQQQLDTTPSTSTTTATVAYEDPNELMMTLQRQHNNKHSCSTNKSDDGHSLYMQHRLMPTGVSNTFCPIALPSTVNSCSPDCPTSTGYNRMVHFPPAPIRCHFSTPVQTFYPPLAHHHHHHPFEPQHIYETIQDGQCPYQRLAATLRRQQNHCTCHASKCEEQKYATRTRDDDVTTTLEPNPETLV